MPRRQKSQKHVPFTQTISCGAKRRFATEKQAQAAADFQMLTDMQLELRVYQCLQCRKWHLTRSTKG